ncbi:MAG: hypothetical protein ACHQNV_06400 [Vicinamibacteria bacterium]
MKVTRLVVTGVLGLSMGLFAARGAQANDRVPYDRRPAAYGAHSHAYRYEGYRPYRSYRYARPYYYAGYAYDGPYAPYAYVPAPVYVPYRPYYGPRFVVRFGFGF